MAEDVVAMEAGNDDKAEISTDGSAAVVQHGTECCMLGTAAGLAITLMKDVTETGAIMVLVGFGNRGTFGFVVSSLVTVSAGEYSSSLPLVMTVEDDGLSGGGKDETVPADEGMVTAEVTVDVGADDDTTLLPEDATSFCS